MPNSPVSYDPGSYKARGLRANSPTYEPPKDIIFHANITPYALVLDVTRKGVTTPSALLSFSHADDSLHCMQIQGAKHRYKQLTPIQWDVALIREFIAIARYARIKEVTILPAGFQEGIDEHNIEKLSKRYDRNALRHGFVFSKERNRFVLEI